MAFQGVETDVPEMPVVLEPVGRLAQWFWRESTAMLSSRDLPSDEPGSLQNHHVLGNGIQRNRERGRNLGDGRCLLSECRQNRAASGIRDRRKHAIQNLGAIFNHTVEYRRADLTCQVQVKNSRGVQD